MGLQLDGCAVRTNGPDLVEEDTTRDSSSRAPKQLDHPASSEGPAHRPVRSSSRRTFGEPRFGADRWRRGGWTRSRRRYGFLPQRPILDADPDWVDSSWQVDDYADVGVFASDLGEYHWLLATRRQAHGGLPLEDEDAQRALTFCFDWILRWQRFDAKYPRPRWGAFWRGQRPPTSAGAGHPKLISAHVGERVVLGSRRRDRVDVLVADVPEHGRGDWGADVAEVLQEVLLSEGLDPLLVEQGPNQPWTGEFQFLAAPELDGARIVRVIEAVIAGSHDRYQSRRTQEAERLEEAERTATAAETLLANAAPDFFGAARAFHQMRPQGEVIVVSVALSMSNAEAGAVVAIMRGAGGPLADAQFEADRRISFTAFELDEEGERALRQAVDAAVQHVEHLRSHVAAAADERRRKQAEIDAASGG